MIPLLQRPIPPPSTLLSLLLFCAASTVALSQQPLDTPVQGDSVRIVDTITMGKPVLPADTLPMRDEDGEEIYGVIPLRHFFFPRPLEMWDRQWILGTSLTIIPREVAEEQLRQAPMIDGRVELGLPLNFHLRARLATNVITNYGSLGAGWNVQFGHRLGLGADVELGYWYGFAFFEGFDITAMGVLATPSVSVGFALNEVLMSLQLDAQISAWRRTESNGIDVTQDGNALSSYGAGIFFEQPLVGNRHIAVGIKLNNARQAYQAWLAFATFNKFLLYPEFSLHLLF